MLRRFSADFILFSMGLDAILIVFALGIAMTVRPFLNTIPYVADMPLRAVPLPLYPLLALLWVVIIHLLSGYNNRRNLFVTQELTALTIAAILATITSAGALYLTYREVSRVLFLMFAFIAYIFLISWRLVYRLSWKLKIAQGAEAKRVLVVGAGPVGKLVAEQIQSFAHLNISVVGFLDDDRKKHDVETHILGALSDAKRAISKYNVNDVVIALPPRAYEKINDVVAELHSLPVKVWVIPDYFHLALHKATIEDFLGIPMLDLRAPALTDEQRMIKRIFDLAITLTFLPPTLFLMGVIALCLKLEGKGPVLFIQQRVGENGRLFNMYKFRTMIPGAENLPNAVGKIDAQGRVIHKTANDPRVTRIGRLLRRTSMDELPQIFNILKGEMSLVGPRPELPDLVEKYEIWQRKRFAVPQGMTGWWQVNGRSDKPMHLHTEDDLYYVQNYSLSLDLYILCKTAWVVLRGKGAY